MKVRTNDLKKILATAGQASASNSTSLAFMSVLLTAENGKLSALCYNGQMSIKDECEELSGASESVVLTTSVIKQIAAKLSGAESSIELGNFQVVIKSGNARFTLACNVKPEEFIKLVADVETTISINAALFAKKMQNTIFAAAVGDAGGNRLMTCLNLKVGNGKCILTCLDGHRVAQNEIGIGDFKDADINIPVDFCKIIANALKSKSGDVSIKTSSKYIVFEIDNTIYMSMLVDGTFFNIDKIINGAREVSVTIDKVAFLDAISRANLITTLQGTKTPVVLTLGATNVTVSAKNALGDMEEIIPSTNKISEAWNRIGFNPKFLEEMLAATENENITIEFLNSKSPVFISGEDFVYLVLPVNIAA